MDQSTTALSVFGWGDGRRWRWWSRGNERESIRREVGGMKTHKETSVVRSVVRRRRRKRWVGLAGPPGVATATHFIFFPDKGTSPWGRRE